MTLKEQCEAMDAILRDVFRNGGPMKASYPRGTNRETSGSIATPKHKSCSALLREQRRLMQTWNQGRRK